MNPAPPPIGQALPDGFDVQGVFRSLFAAYPDALLVVDTAGRIVLANDGAAQLLGYGVGELVGRVDALVHVAGGFEMGEGVAQMTRASWDRMLGLNAWSFVALAKPVVAQMRTQGSGSIVAVSAAAAGGGQALKGAYIASKSALQRLVESLAQEVAGSGIRVNSVAPTTLDTPVNRAAMPDADRAAWVSTAAAAEAIAFLATRSGEAVQGQHLRLGA